MPRLSVIALVAAACGPVEIAAFNGSDHDFVDLAFHDIAWGDLAPGETTTFFRVTRAYSYTFVGLSIEGQDLFLQPIDYVGETPLSPGRYVYEITVVDLPAGQLGLSLEEDR